MQRHEDALESYERTLAVMPGHVAALNNRGNALSALRRSEEALASFDARLRSRRILPTRTAIGPMRCLLCRPPDEALVSADRALALKPASPRRSMRGAMRCVRLITLRRSRAGVHRARPGGPALRSRAGRHRRLRATRMRLAALRGDAARVTAAVHEGRRAALPRVFLGVSGSAAAQLACARTFVAERFPAARTRCGAASVTATIGFASRIDRRTFTSTRPRT
jgi:tetratricopeptide (TPR) repeat protein